MPTVMKKSFFISFSSNLIGVTAPDPASVEKKLPRLNISLQVTSLPREVEDGGWGRSNHGTELKTNIYFEHLTGVNSLSERSHYPSRKAHKESGRKRQGASNER